MSVSKRPKNSLPRQTRDDYGVFGDVGFVVVINEIVTQRLPEDDPGEARQGDTYCPHPRAGDAQCLFHTGSRNGLNIAFIPEGIVERHHAATKRAGSCLRLSRCQSVFSVSTTAANQAGPREASG